MKKEEKHLSAELAADVNDTTVVPAPELPHDANDIAIQSLQRRYGLNAATAMMLQNHFHSLRLTWQPIETFTGEGVDLLLHFPDFNEEYRVMVGHRIESTWYPQDADMCPEPFDAVPTHWMPLPEPPK